MKNSTHHSLYAVAATAVLSLAAPGAQAAAKKTVSRPLATAVPSSLVSQTTSAIIGADTPQKGTTTLAEAAAPTRVSGPVVARRVVPSVRVSAQKVASVKAMTSDKSSAKIVSVVAPTATATPQVLATATPQAAHAAVASKVISPVSSTDSKTVAPAATATPKIEKVVKPVPSDSNVVRVIEAPKGSVLKGSLSDSGRVVVAVATPEAKTEKDDKVEKRVTSTSAKPSVRIARATPPRRTPTNLQSRHRDRMLLAQLEADLGRAQSRLNSANVTLNEGQKQLMAVGNTLRSAMLEAGPDARGLHPFVRVAQRYAGTPYVWGGESRRGFDCSGFIMVVMRDLGYKALPHSAAEQFNYGQPVAKALLKPGDLVFFANTYKPGISHVGIYLGKSRFIHAAGTGTGTIVSSLNEPKWVEKYAGARRLIAG